MSASSKPIPDTKKMILLRIQTLLLDIHIRKLAVLHPHNAVGEFIDAAVMSDDDDAAFVGKNILPHKTDDVAACIAVKRCRRFIKDQNIRAADDGAGNGDALLLAAAEFHRRQLRAVLQSDNIQIGCCFLKRFIPVAFLKNERNGDILSRRQARKEMIVLKHKADFVQPEFGKIVVG